MDNREIIKSSDLCRTRSPQMERKKGKRRSSTKGITQLENEPQKPVIHELGLNFVKTKAPTVEHKTSGKNIKGTIEKDRGGYRKRHVRDESWNLTKGWFPFARTVPNPEGGNQP